MAVLLHFYFGLRATLQTVVSVNLKGTVSDTEVLASGIPLRSILGRYFSPVYE